MSTGKRYEVRGADERGDVHVFGSDDEGAAREVLAMMREDLKEVTLTDSEYPA